MPFNGYQPGTVSPSARRADFDLRRRADEVFIGPSAPVQSNYELWFNTTDQILYVWWSDEWVPLSVGTPGPEGPPGPQGPPGTGGGTGTGTDEVWVGPDDPIAAHPTIELWVDSDDSSGGGGGGTVGTLSYVHTQPTVSATWMVEHHLGWFPNVTVIDSAGSTVEGDVAHIDNATLTISFSGAFSGTAYLS
ncbi:MAG TPA: hypothetical protein VFE69_08165 [Ilumatobacteraceae bacterium]|jgi:hypothetical protein|nr:hypothetical protein [Ilumatobacteraceae bacterium]